MSLNIGASGISFALTLISTPIMTRLFSPEAYGVYGILNNGATVAVGLGMLGLSLALPQERDPSQQHTLIEALIQLALMLTVLAAIFGFGALILAPIGSALAQFGFVLLLVPILVLSNALQRIVDSVAVLNGAFSAMAQARIANAVAARVITVGVGFLFLAGSSIMVLGDALGKFVQSGMTAWRGQLGHAFHRVRLLPNIRKLWQTIRAYRAFATYGNITGLLPGGTVLLIQATIGAIYGVSELGQFVLARSIMVLPASLISLSTAPIIYHRFIHLRNEAPHRLLPMTGAVFAGYGLTGAIILLPVYLYGPPLFGFVFGAQWQQAGALAALLFVPQALEFSLTSLQSLFHITRRLRLWFMLELLGASVMMGVFVTTASQLPLEQSIALLAVLMTGRQLLLLAGCLGVVVGNRRESKQGEEI